MTRSERLKEEIAYEKQVLFVLFAAGLAMIGWLFSNRLEVETWLLYAVGAAAASDATILAHLHRRIKNKMQELEKQ